MPFISKQDLDIQLWQNTKKGKKVIYMVLVVVSSDLIPNNTYVFNLRSQEHHPLIHLPYQRDRLDVLHVDCLLLLLVFRCRHHLELGQKNVRLCLVDHRRSVLDLM